MFGSTVPVGRTTLDEHRRFDAMAAVDIGFEFGQPVRQRAAFGPQVVVRIDDRRVGVDHLLGHLVEPGLRPGDRAAGCGVPGGGRGRSVAHCVIVAHLDAVTCCVSVDHLIRPLDVFADVARVLRAGGGLSGDPLCAVWARTVQGPDDPCTDL
jgi:hypothetical protein